MPIPTGPPAKFLEHMNATQHWRLLVALKRLLESSPQFLLIYSPAAWLFVLLLGGSLYSVGLVFSSDALVLAAIPIALVAIVGLGLWGWILRPSGKQRLVLVARFKETSTTQGISQAGLHQGTLVEELSKYPGNSDVEFRKCFLVGERAASALVRARQVEGVVFGRALLAIDQVRWDANLLYRMWGHSRKLSGTGGPGSVWKSAPRLTRIHRTQSWRDGAQDIRLLASNEFPAEHAVGIAAVLASNGGPEPVELDDIQEVLDWFLPKWELLPVQAKALLRVMESTRIEVVEGLKPAMRFLERAIHTEGLRDHVLQLQFTSYCILAFGLGTLPTARFERAVLGLQEIEADDPYLPYMMGCVRMGQGKWQDASQWFKKANREYRFQEGLGPEKGGVATAWLQAAALWHDDREFHLAHKRARKIVVPLWRRLVPIGRSSLDERIFASCWLSRHPYDKRALSAMESRLRELGVDADLSELRRKNDSARKTAESS
jgi:hypothetical protein